VQKTPPWGAKDGVLEDVTTTMSDTPGAEDSVCMVCKDDGAELVKKRAKAMIPCGHFTICKPCFHRCDKCPVCRTRYNNNETIMTAAEETRLIARLQRFAARREALDDQIAALQEKRAAVDEEFNQLTAVRERQRILLRRRANHLDESNF